jgi:histidine ammonia-lyase
VPRPQRLILDGASLTLDALSPVLAGEPVTLKLSAAARANVQRARAVVDAHVAAGDVVYGLSTGFGKL